jgi:nicotinamide riboside kinase
VGGFVVTLLGAESTGKSTLARQLAERLAADGVRAALVPEVLREFCDQAGRTPLVHEQAGIAAEQTRRIAAAAQDHDVVVADTSALMIAVYSEIVFGDRGLYAQARADHARADLTLLTALDLPWQADGLMRDGPHVREPVDTLVRGALGAAGLPFSIVAGQGTQRLDNAWGALRRARAGAPSAGARTRWHWVCERCGDADCERHRLPRG